MGFIFQSFIDIPVWNRARWHGVLWMWPPNVPPGMGLLFRDHRAGTDIFREWKNRLGDVDKDEQLRVSIIEGPIVGADPGYTVRIGTNIETLRRLARERGLGNEESVVLSASRIHRMNPPPGSPNLANFRKAFAQYGKYAIVQVVPDDKPPGVIPVFESAIMKSEIPLPAGRGNWRSGH